MDPVDLDRRHRTYDGWIPPTVAALLLEYGHLGVLRDQADAGDWFCAHRLARAAADRGEALALLEPFVAAGWMPALRTVAGLLAEWDRVDEAVALLGGPAGSGDRRAALQLAPLLARLGRIDEVVALLGPRAADQASAETLVEVTAGHGRDAEIAALLPAVGVGATDPFERGSSDAWNTVPLHATLLERQGRVDEAADLLRRHVHVDGVMYADHAQQLAGLLARHGREAGLRAFAADGGEEYALFALADHLEARHRVDEAVETLRRAAGVPAGPHVALHLAELLVRHGRRAEAIEVLRPVPHTMGGDPEWILRPLCRLLADEGRPDEALAYVDDFYARHGGTAGERLRERAEVHAHCGPPGEAVADLRAAGPVTRYVVEALEELLPGHDLGIGCADDLDGEALDGTSAGAIARAERLVRRGEPERAVALLRDRLDGPKVLRREHL
ncbi:tetratricopeptide repeat protein [Streptomyces erythrochromogenes]|uniref:tetratricopeptide repeat protein n=1 Tax=Streptomyces erythrochromogenes TaxID=285574 RepID=UPI0036AE4412